MNVAEYKKEVGRQKNPHANCNALWKTRQSVNCYLKPEEAIQLARILLEKAQLILERQISDGVVQLWNKGESSERLYVGVEKARQGGRRKKKAAAK